MKRKIFAVVIGGALFALISAAVYAAQKEENRNEPRVRAMTLVNPGEGRARLGVSIADINAENMHELKLAGEYGALVKEVEPDTPAAKAGLEANDVILEFDGERVRSAAQLRRLIQDTPAGRTVSIKISRGGLTRTLNVKLAAASSELVTPEVVVPQFEMPEIRVPNFDFNFLTAGPRLGISAEGLTPQLAQYFGVTQGKGVLVQEVTAGSAAEKAGLKAGDCIVRLGDTKVESVADLRRALDGGSNENHEVNLTIVRDRHEQTLKVELEAPSRMMRHRIAQDQFISIDRNELLRLKSELQASAAALREARRALTVERHSLISQSRQMRDELRRELGKGSLDRTKWRVD